MSTQSSRREFLAVAAGVAPDAADQPVLEPDLPIIDPHLHLRAETRRGPTTLPDGPYLLPEALADIYSGHNIVKAVAIESSSMYRADGPPEMRVVGEVEFVNGIAAMSASGQYGPCRVAAGIVSKADLIQGARIEPVLEALVWAGDGRLRGVRDVISWEDHGVYPIKPDRKGVMDNPSFREGLSRLKPLGLAFEGQTFHMQVLDFARMADAFPDTTFILEHLSTPLGVKFYEGKHAEIFAQWRPDMKELGKRHNVAVQLGGLGMAGFGSPFFGRNPPARAEELVAEWRPWIETAIEACGPDKCMFESNFPTERPTCDYRTKWNVFKTIAAQYAPAEKAALFHDTAQRVYRLAE